MLEKKQNATVAEILGLPNVSSPEITVIIFQSVHNNNNKCVKGQIYLGVNSINSAAKVFEDDLMCQYELCVLQTVAAR